MKITRYILTNPFLHVYFSCQARNHISLSLCVYLCVCFWWESTVKLSQLLQCNILREFFSFILGKETSSHDVTFHMLSHAPARIKNLRVKEKRCFTFFVTHENYFKSSFSLSSQLIFYMCNSVWNKVYVINTVLRIMLGYYYKFYYIKLTNWCITPLQKNK